MNNKDVKDTPETKSVPTSEEVMELPAVPIDELVQIAQAAQQRIEAIKLIKTVALGVTNARDWVDQQGRPYLQASGCEKVARTFGISWQILGEPQVEHLPGGHIQVTYKARFSLGKASIEAIGVRASNEPFFSTRWKKNGEKITLPASEITLGDVKKAAYTNCLANGISRLLGIRNLTWEDVEQFAGIKREQVSRVEYRQRKLQSEDRISQAQQKRLWAIARQHGLSDDEVRSIITQAGYTSTAEIKKDEYDGIIHAIEMQGKLKNQPTVEDVDEAPMRGD